MSGTDSSSNGQRQATRRSKARGVVHILVERCKGCGFCVEFCPRGVLVVSERYNAKGYHPPEVIAPGECSACRLCELLCPDFALGIEEIVTAKPKRDDDPTEAPKPQQELRGPAEVSRAS